MFYKSDYEFADNPIEISRLSLPFSSYGILYLYNKNNIAAPISGNVYQRFYHISEEESYIEPDLRHVFKPDMI